MQQDNILHVHTRMYMQYIILLHVTGILNIYNSKYTNKLPLPLSLHSTIYKHAPGIVYYVYAHIIYYPCMHQQ